MTVEGQRDPFPAGMRVLAVDDNPICLKTLEALLRKCKYHVTTTNQAIKALEMLRGNRDKYDLVISDVQMPDMDGFKLLELLGLEMDLPVIMLSGYSDTELVMKGISHGACDYLVKPCRFEELKNIWQHVVRKKKFEPKELKNSSDQGKACNGAGEDIQGASQTGSSDHQNGNLNRKRKDHNRVEKDESEDDEYENEDGLTQKKSRVVWSPELHRKFVIAVHQLGEEKAVPKKILDLMDVEGLSRENVASHLQKYRQYLRKTSSGMAPFLGGKDSSYLRMSVLDGFGDPHSLNRSGRLSSSPLSSYTYGGMLPRFNSSVGSSTRGITSSNLVQLGHSQNLSNYANTFSKFQPPLDFNQLQQTKFTNHIGKSYLDNGPKIHMGSSRFRESGVSCSSLPSDTSFPSNHLLLQGIPQQTHSTGLYGNQSSLVPFDTGISSSCNFLDYNRISQSLQGVGAQLSTFPSNALPMSEPFNHGQLHADNLGVSSSRPQIGNTLNDFSSSSALSAPVDQLRGTIQNQEGLNSDVMPMINYAPRQCWDEQNRGYNHELNQTFRPINSLGSTLGGEGHISQNLHQNDAVCNYDRSSSLFDQLNGATATVMQPAADKGFVETNLKPNEDCFLEQTDTPNGLVRNSYDSVNDIMSTIMKQEQNENLLLDSDSGFDAYP